MKRELDQLLLVGDQMANLCFNLSQSSEQSARNQTIMAELRDDWDHFRRALKAESRTKPKRAAAGKGER